MFRMKMDNSNLQKEGIELIHPGFARGEIHSALFDFDGTLSLIREGWQGIMIPMMVEILEKTPRQEGHDAIEQLVTEFVTLLTGKQTIYQMMKLCEEISLRGGQPEDPVIYKKLYNDRLNKHIHARLTDLQSGQVNPVDIMVPGALKWLQILEKRGVQCYLASGTDECYVQEEANLLGIAPYFVSIHGALDDLSKYSKKMVIEKIIRENKLSGPQFVVFGDGYIEIEDSKAAGGIAVGVASDEKARSGLDAWKRSRLIEAGADLIIADFLCAPTLENFLFARNIADL